MKNNLVDTKELVLVHKNNKFQNIIRIIKIYLSYFKIKFLNEIQYKIAAIAGVLTQFAWGGMYIMLYTAFLKGSNASDYTIPQMCTYIWLQQAFYSLFNVWSLDNDILEECRTGNISMELIRPIDLYSIWHAKTLGRKVAMMSLRAIPILVLCSMPFMEQYRLMAPVSIGALIASIITLFLTVALMLAYVMIMYVCIMKTMVSQGLRTTFDLIMQFCSGGLIPIPFMPEVVVNILKFTPFYYMQNVTFNIYNGYISNPTEILQIIIVQMVWLGVFTFVGKKIMNNQLSKVVVQGG